MKVYNNNNYFMISCQPRTHQSNFAKYGQNSPESISQKQDLNLATVKIGGCAGQHLPSTNPARFSQTGRRCRKSAPPPLKPLALELQHTESAPDMNISWCKLDT
ncbi:hypothetical protein Zmor_017511 [Zophobas morio]|uniref:Uncharacterized protein n=1 Tax=Zophobas morio TaxID=2755281 RepID=A0AA38MCP0_9CUCU|nr:hypothetical protein Zmor_017511 [Zophobas morio]